MTKNELKNKLKEIGVKKNEYSINEGLKTDAYILEEIDGLWKFYYYDERGNDSSINYLKSEEEAYEYLLNKFLNQLKLMGNKNFNKY